MDWTGSQGFDPGLGSESSAHIFDLFHYCHGRTIAKTMLWAKGGKKWSL